MDQVALWDGTHIKWFIGGINPDKSFQLIFPRNKEGDVDTSSDGEYTEERKSQLNVKYEKECCLGLEVAMVTPLD